MEKVFREGKDWWASYSENRYNYNLPDSFDNVLTATTWALERCIIGSQKYIRTLEKHTVMIYIVVRIRMIFLNFNQVFFTLTAKFPMTQDPSGLKTQDPGTAYKPFQDSVLGCHQTRVSGDSLSSKQSMLSHTQSLMVPKTDNDISCLFNYVLWWLLLKKAVAPESTQKQHAIHLVRLLLNNIFFEEFFKQPKDYQEEL